MTRPRRPAQALRGAIDCMPLQTRTAMRDALAANSIIVGAYSDRDGGVCPMLAAHRNGGRTSFAAFARAWDRYTGAGEAPRRATGREVRTLAAMLDASIAGHDAGAADLDAGIVGHGAGATDLAGAIAGHRESQSRRRGGPRPATVSPRRHPTGERDRTGELASRHGWAWLRPFRRLDEYERALMELEDVPEPRPAPERAPA